MLSMKESGPPQSLSGVLNQLVESTEGERVRVEDILNSLGTRAYGPLLLVTSAIEVLPFLGAIPGAYIPVALIVILLAGQILLFRPHPWLPARLRRFSISRERLVRSVERFRPWAVRIDRVLKPRLTSLVRPPFLQLIALICIAMALLFFPLAFIPASEKVLAVPIFFFGLALTAGDGLLAAIGLTVTTGIMLVGIYYSWQLASAL